MYDDENNCYYTSYLDNFRIFLFRDMCNKVCLELALFAVKMTHFIMNQLPHFAFNIPLFRVGL